MENSITFLKENFYFASDADADAEVFFQAELKEMSLMGTMTPPIEKKVTLLNFADGCDLWMDGW